MICDLVGLIMDMGGWEFGKLTLSCAYEHGNWLDVVSFIKKYGSSGLIFTWEWMVVFIRIVI